MKKKMGLRRRYEMEAKNVDKTIDAICESIQNELKKPNFVYCDSTLPDMTKALAALVSARAQLN